MLAIAAISWGPVKESKQDQWESVAGVPGSFLSIGHAMNMLKRQGIESTSMGSVVYGILVKPKDASKARELLNADKEVNPWHYVDLSETARAKRDKWNSSPELRKFDIDLKGFDEKEPFRSQGLLRGMARLAFKEALRQVESGTAKQPYIKSMRLWSKPYLDEKFAVRPAYMGEVRVGFRKDSGVVWNCYMDAWADGWLTQSFGGNGNDY